MAVLKNMAMIITMAMVVRSGKMKPSLPRFVGAEYRAEDLVAQLFKDHGWKVQPRLDIGPYEVDFLIKRGRQAFAVEVKAFAEGRPDRVIPLLSHAIIQAQAYARKHGKARPLAIIHVGDASPSLIRQVQEFSRHYADDVAIGLVSDNGVRHFIGEGLESLNAEASVVRAIPDRPSGRIPQLFSDLNQWMLKVLLAPELPEHLLAAPRGSYRNVSELAKAADVSMMSASRFVRQLRAEGYVDKSAPHLRVVRRADLFRRWQASGLRASPNEIPMVFMFGGSIEKHLSQLDSLDACLALFAAADALKLGHVSGVPPHVYGPRWGRLDSNLWPVLPAPGGAKPDFILREAPSPQSVFRGMVRPAGVPVCDAIQIWLDVSGHPSRGSEQAALIYRKVLSRVVEGSGS